MKNESNKKRRNEENIQLNNEESEFKVSEEVKVKRYF